MKVENGNIDPGVHAFCATRWMIGGSTLGSIIGNHKELITLWEDSLKITKDVDMKALIIGAQSQMQKFYFYFGCRFGEIILSQTDNFGKTLSAAEGQYLAELVLETLRKDRCEEKFSLFWDLVLIKIKGLLNEPILPRKRKLPIRFQSGCETSPSTNEMYWEMYFEAYDNAINSIVQRFNQPDYMMYATMQNILLMSIRGVGGGGGGGGGGGF